MLTFERYAFPRIGKMPVSEVTSADVLEILAPIWHTKADTARRLRQRIRAVLEWAVAMEFRIDNPCHRIGPVLGPQHNVVQHMRALPHREVAAAIRTARASTVPPAGRLAFEFLVLTAARWGEVRWAEWTEIDRDEGVWTVPARRMKANREHRVPLCGRAVEILDEARSLVEGTSPFLFPNRVGKQLRGEATAPDVPEARDRGRATRFSLELPGLGGRRDGSSARGHRGSPRACGPEQGRGGLSANGPVRPPVCLDGRLDGLLGRREQRPGGRIEPLIPRALTAALGGLPGTDIWTEVSLQGRKGKTHLDPRRRTKPSASAVTQEVAPPTCGLQGG